VRSARSLHAGHGSLHGVTAAAPLRHTQPMRLRQSQVWLLSACCWTLFGVVSGMQIWISMLSHHHSLARIIVYQVLVWNAWVLFGFVVARLVRERPLVPPSARHIGLHVVVAAVYAVAHAAWWVGLELWIRPYDFMNPTRFVSRYPAILVCQMPLELVLYGLVALAVHASDAADTSRERELRAVHLERSLAEARLHALELQIRPHFLFNTLNAISSLVRVGDNASAIGMIGGLSDLLRYSLERAGDSRVALEDDVKMLERFLDIQRLRFVDRLTFEIDLAPEARRAAVPVLLLQPLVENAIHHGIGSSGGPGRIVLSAARRDDMLRIELFNTGRLTEPIVSGIGLSNTHARLQQLYGSRHRFELMATADGVTARLELPFSEAGKPEAA
jgi:two-component system LytT family sensor kinase